jgi:hypothetical protein
VNEGHAIVGGDGARVASQRVPHASL